jgi:L-2-hydroxyglutarate oxidase LhgO
MADTVDVLVIGAGVVGLAVAREFAMQGREVVVVEKASAIGTGTSSRNSEVIHAGIYYEPGSLKARLCVKGKKLLYDYCATNGVEARRIGKLIVAQSESELPKLAAIKNTAMLNGVSDLVELNAAQVRDLEPDVNCIAALLSPSTGIVDCQSLMLSLQGGAEAHGAMFAFQTKVIAGKPHSSGVEVTLEDGSGNLSHLNCATVINCAGHGAHEVAMALTSLPTANFPPRFLAKGSYCSVSGKAPFTHLIYPIPVPGALGIHVTLDMQGHARLGPNIEWVDHENYTVSETIVLEFLKACEGFWPGIRDRAISTAYCGIRPKISGPNERALDFYIATGHSLGAPRLVNLFGIESPGLTSALAISRYVESLVGSTSQIITDSGDVERPKKIANN